MTKININDAGVYKDALQLYFREILDVEDALTSVEQNKADVEDLKDEVQTLYNSLTSTPSTVSTSTYTLQLSDLGKVIRFTNACVVTLPATFPAGWYCCLRRAGTGAVTWANGGSATNYPYPSGTGISAQRASVVASVDSNAGSAAVWIIEGAIS